MVAQSDDQANEIIRRFDQISGQRGTWESHWTEIAERVMPSYSRSFQNGGIVNQGEKNTQHLFDATAALALNKFSAAMESMLTPRNSIWHHLVPPDKLLKRNREIRLWFEDVTDVLFKYRYAPKANYASNQHEVYNGLGAFGTGVLFTDKLQQGGLRYKAIHLAEIFFLENHQGIIDTAIRKFPLSARQAVQKWGKEKLPEKIVGALEKTPDKEFFFIHCVKPREDVDPERADYKGMEYASYYVSYEAKQIVSEGGFNSFPYSISRYVLAPGEVYGRSPAMLALPAIKTLNEQKKTILKQGHRIVDPVLLAHDDGVVDTFSLKPGAINYGGVDAQGRVLVHPLPTGNLAVGKDMMDDERAAINDAFLVTLFQILVESPQMTATEVLERAREKGALLSPTMGRQQSEALGPMIEREIDVLAQQGLIPPMPDILREARGEFQIEYDSPLSRAQKAEEAAGLMRTVEHVLNVVNITQNPEPLDHFDWDTIIPELSDINAVPVRWRRSMDAIQEIRAGRAEQAQTQQMIEAAPAVAGAAKAMSGAAS